MGKKYLFTDKKHSPQAIMATVLGLISNIALGFAIYSTYKLGGVATDRLGSTGFMILLFSTVGLILGYVSKARVDEFHFFSYVGIVLNLIALLGVSMVLYAGAYGI
ncbi:MAG: DUF6142 family protein [Lachnospiraceae bacterium]|nr:DUF6142 family protein [Lachnospiraceae bacterium]